MFKGKKCVSTWLLVLRVVLWLVFIYHGIMKFNNPGMADFVWWAAHKLWLTFLSTDMWFNIVKYTEVIVWAGLILGLWTCLCAFILFIVILVAINTKWRSIDKSELGMVVAGSLLALMITWGGRYALICNRWGKCNQCNQCNNHQHGWGKSGIDDKTVDQVEEIVEKTVVETE